ELAAGGDPTAPVLSDAVSIDVPAQAGEPPQTPKPPSRNAALPPETSPAIAGSSAAPGPEAALSNPQAAPAFDAAGAMTYRPHAASNRLRVLPESAKAMEAKRDSDLLAIAPPS